MSKLKFFEILKKEVARIDAAKITKRAERVIEGFTDEASPKAIINGKKVRIFNSNDYLGLRHNKILKQAERSATEIYGTGPGAVRFISGSLKIYQDLEKKVAQFHNREAAQLFSSAFAANMAVLFCLITGQSKDSVVDSNVLVVSDALNHRSIIDGIRIANLPKEQRAIFAHMDADDLRRILDENKAKYKRALIITDGVFSMLGEFQRLKKVRKVIDEYDKLYEMGAMLVVDDAHGVGAAGMTGRGTEELEGARADVLIGTFGKALGADGGYVAADQAVIDYLRESAATYIYSNPFAPGTAGAARASLELLDTKTGKELLKKLQENIAYFKRTAKSAGFIFAADSAHAIQPILIGDTAKTRALVDALFAQNILVTNISYPVVPKGADEIRIQISAAHTKEDLDTLTEKLEEAGKKLQILS